MRKGIDGLSSIVDLCLVCSSFESAMFIFCNPSRRVKILEWNHDGFWLYQKRLEKGTLPWPKEGKVKKITLSGDEFSCFLAGTKLRSRLAMMRWFRGFLHNTVVGIASLWYDWIYAVFLLYYYPIENVRCELEELKTKCSELEHKNSDLKEKNSYIEDKNSELSKLVAYYEECFRLNQHRQFGESNEKADSDSRQILLVFHEAENEAEVKMLEPSVEETSYIRRRCTGSKEDNFEALPVERILHSIREEERLCPECDGPMHIIGHEKRRELEIIPAQVKIVEHEREVYSCRRCEHENIKVPIIKAPIPETPIKGDAESAAFIAHIMVQKYMNSVPLYLHEMPFLNEGFFLSRQALANWLIRASSGWLEP